MQLHVFTRISIGHLTQYIPNWTIPSSINIPFSVNTDESSYLLFLFFSNLTDILIGESCWLKLRCHLHFDPHLLAAPTQVKPSSAHNRQQQLPHDSVPISAFAPCLTFCVAETQYLTQLKGGKVYFGSHFRSFSPCSSGSNRKKARWK